MYLYNYEINNWIFHVRKFTILVALRYNDYKTITLLGEIVKYEKTIEKVTTFYEFA